MNRPGAAACSFHLCAALAGALLASGAQAQTAPDPPSQPATPNRETPPGGVARGVIEPRQNHDPEAVVTPPPTGGAMPVIPPPVSAPGSRVEPK